MRNQIARSLCLLTCLAATRVLADVSVTLDATDAEGNPLSTTVEAGTTVFIELSLSATGADVPLMDVRGIEFAFASSSSTIDLVAYQWMLSPPNGDTLYLKTTKLPSPGTAYIQTGRIEGFIIDLSDEPTLVGVIEVVINTSGTFNAGVGSAFASNGGLTVTVGFDPVSEFSTSHANLTGGTLDFVVPGTEPPDDNVNENEGGGGGQTNDNSAQSNDNGSGGNANSSNANSSNTNDNSSGNGNSNGNANGGNANTGGGGNTNANGGAGNANSGDANDNSGDNANGGGAANDNGGGVQANENGSEPNDNGAGSNDNGSQNANSGGGSGNNGGGGGFSFCGMGMLGPATLMLATLVGLRTRRRNRV